MRSAECGVRSAECGVRSAEVERLKGDIRMESSAQQGTAVQMRLPLSLATTRLLLAAVGDRRYGLPIEFVHTSRRVREEDFFPRRALRHQPGRAASDCAASGRSIGLAGFLP